MQCLQLFLLSHVIPRHVLFSSADSGANGTYYCFVYPKFSRQRDPTCAVDASWPLGGMHFIAPLVLFELYICVKILKFTKSSHFTKNIFTRASYTCIELQSGHQVSSALRYQVTSSHLKSKREKKGFGFGRVKIAFATSHERIIKMDNDNNHMQEKVTNTYMHMYMHIYSYGLNMVGFWIWVGVKIHTWQVGVEWVELSLGDN